MASVSSGEPEGEAGQESSPAAPALGGPAASRGARSSRSWLGRGSSHGRSVGSAVRGDVLHAYATYVCS